MQCKRYASECKRGCTTICAAKDSYHPSNGTEGMGFTEEYCEQCIHDHPDPDHPKKCEILTATLCYYPTDPQYPKEWIIRDNRPLCTAFVKWDWGSDGDPDDPDNPKAPPPPPDPNQTNLFPLYPNELTYERQQQSVPATRYS